MAMFERRMIEVDAATLEIFLCGDHGPLVCDAHPFGGYSGQLADEDRPLAAARIVQVNGRGAGRSSPGRDPQDFTVDRFVADLETVRLQLGGEPWIFMSTSAGVYAALRYALRYPHALRGLITGFLGTNLRQIVDDPESIISAANPAHQQVLATKRRPAAGAGPFSRWVQQRETLWLWYDHDHPVVVWPFELPQHTRGYLTDMLIHPVDDRLDAITASTLIFAGRDDPLAPPRYVEVLRSIPGSEFVPLDCGHIDMSAGHGLEEYQAALRRFLTEHSYPLSTP